MQMPQAPTIMMTWHLICVPRQCRVLVVVSIQDVYAKNKEKIKNNLHELETH